ncbi:MULTISPECIES: TetR/AcrR family transcriptional regulator [unclassified Rathayibacter]|uniref:TetR/AcrR family transcriptional regulator n=1 Tax=unclassified Rathayibacter TaxID=2609250 RepID=UPI0006FF25F4|nr:MULTISPECIES: TetR/AcrR family transcriptional regulator [unclassified Rathayibacter]KQQ05504.1 TetR family transcriptional regulator [Rathayibacter sp. Leaf294]KQS13367.1 TetR family transcriptional regulator [Rathayibacter sp. Leaf185]
MSSTGLRSTAEAQRERITLSALRVFAATGYSSTPVTEVATDAGVSPAYVFRLFPGKLGLFVAAVDRCYALVSATLAAAGEASPSSDPADRLEAMSEAYIALVADRDLIRLQVHAQSACEVPEIRDAVRRGLSELVRTVSVVTGADGPAVQRFLAYGQLCHLIVQAELDGVDSEWARIATAGMRHPG